MNDNLRSYVPLPDFLFLADQKLQYLDVLVYTALRWHNKVEANECFPMHETVGKMAGVSKRFVIESIKRLEEAKLIYVKRSYKKRVSNLYYFVKPRLNKRKEKIPKDFFELTTNLTKCERAMLLCVRQFFHNRPFECHETKPIEFFAKYLQLSKDQVRKQFSGLVAKGYIDQRAVLAKCGSKARRYYKLTEKIDWNFDEYLELQKIEPMVGNKFSIKVA